MPDHTPEHMARLTRHSAAARRAHKIARLLETAPTFTPEQVALRVQLVNRRAGSMALS